MVHAERVLDHSGASNYSKLKLYRVSDMDFRTKFHNAQAKAATRLAQSRY